MLIFPALLLSAIIVYSTPFGATITYISNETKQATNGTIANFTDGDETSGGYIFYTNISGVQQNPRWKAFVGNASGKLTLDDASSNTIYDWTLTGSPTGQIYATRDSGSINWTGIRCAYRNITELENINMSLTSKNDNITTTFSVTNNTAFTVGTVTIAENTCNTTHLYVNDTAQTDNTFQEVLLYDGPPTQLMNETLPSTSMIYAVTLESDIYGFDTQTYDFQMIVPEIGLSTWTSSTAYYFFIELT